MVPGGKGPRKQGNKIRVRVKAFNIMDFKSHVLTGLPRHEVTKRRKDQDGGEGPLPLWTWLSFAGVKYRTESVCKIYAVKHAIHRTFLAALAQLKTRVEMPLI